MPCTIEPYQLDNIFFQASIPDRSHYRPGWQRNPTLVKMHEKYNEGNVSNESRIVGGTEVIPHSFPHQVAMFIDGSFFCGGSLICKQFLAPERRKLKTQNINTVLPRIVSALE